MRVAITGASGLIGTALATSLGDGGHDVVRLVRGKDPDAGELARMVELTRQGMIAGGFGLSSGLYYAPGSYSKTAEVIAMARATAPFGGVYSSHIRDEGDELLEAIDEVIQIARGANLPCHISHLKASKRANWGKVRVAARIVEQALQLLVRDHVGFRSGSRIRPCLPRAARNGNAPAGGRRATRSLHSEV